MKNTIFKTGAFGTGVLTLVAILTGCAAGVGTGSELASTVNEDLTVTVEVDGLIAKLGQATLVGHNVQNPEEGTNESIENADDELAEMLEITVWDESTPSALSDFAATYFAEMEGGFYLGAVVTDINGCLVDIKLPMTLNEGQDQATVGAPVVTNSCDMLIENEMAEMASSVADFWNSNPIVFDVVMDEEAGTITLSKPEGDRLMSETVPGIDPESDEEGVIEEFSVVIQIQDSNSATIIPVVSDFTTLEPEEEVVEEQEQAQQ